jgi:type IV pilus assembly protein PilQ
MTVTRASALFFSLAIAVALADLPGTAAEAPAAGVRLTSISSRANASTASLVIEATEPVPYATMRPDPLTVVLDFRNVGTEGLANLAAINAPRPIANVAVEPLEAGGVPASRVRVTLAAPVNHRVRSDRNRVVVEFDVPVAQQATSAAPVALADPNIAPVDPIAALGLGAEPAPPAAAFVQAPAAQPPPSRPLPDQAPSTRSGRTYSGQPVSLDFQGADLRAVLRTFSEISGLNLVIDPGVQGSVDVALREVPWDQALDQILRANKLGYLVDGTIVRIAPLTVLADEEAQRRKLAEEQALAGELRVLTRTLSYARAQDMQALLTRSALSQRGTVQVDPRTNTLIITDLENRLTTASDLLSTLDTPQPQVEIEARIVQTTRDFARSLGIDWGFGGRVDPALGNTTNLAFPNSGTLTGRTALPADGAPVSSVGLSLGAVNGAFNLDVALNALERTGNGRLLSTPRVSTQNNVAAEITQGTQIPIQTVSNNTVTVGFKDAALTLRVTPQITAANTVIMRIELENAEPDFGRSVNGIPPIDTQRANTTVLVNDGQTTVIGGIYLSREDTNTDRTPGLSRVPILNWLFRRDNISERSTELLIFITPRISRG